MAEKELIARIKNKDKAAVKELYLCYSSIMLGICKRYCGNREDAKDIMHEQANKFVVM
jgi:RNA polymerase sigma-70 factor (ECF subfamily)